MRDDTHGVNDMSTRQVSGEPTAIWLRRGDESAAAFSAFVTYRDQVPPRSIRKAARVRGRGQRTLEAWSSRHKWVERAAAYTDHLDRISVAAHEDDIARRRREVNERIFQTASEIHTVVAARLGGVNDEKHPVAAFDPNTLGAADVIRWFESSAKWGRLSIGLPASLTGSTTITLKDNSARSRRSRTCDRRGPELPVAS